MVTIKFFTRLVAVNDSSIDGLKNTISESLGLSVDDYYLVCDGRILQNEYDSSGKTVHVVLRTLGGKGGFGSMLRAIGAQIEKTTNREACRDLSGRRLRDINEEKRLKTWISQKEEREREAREKKRQKLERLCQGPKIELKDESYMKERLELTENVSDSIEQGLKASCSGVSSTKRKSSQPNNPPSKKKKKALMLDFDVDSDDDSSLNSSEDEGSADSNNKSQVKCNTELSVVQ